MPEQSDKVVAIIVSRLDFPLHKPRRTEQYCRVHHEQGYDPIMMESKFSAQMVEEHLGMLQRHVMGGGTQPVYRPKRGRAQTLAAVTGAAGARRQQVCLCLLR